MQREWQAVHDNRTRHEHRILDGQRRGIDEPFEVEGEKIMYPADPSAAPYLIWNCRCDVRAIVDGWEDKIGELYDFEEATGMTYEEWKAGKPKSEPITKQEDIGNAMKYTYIKELYT